jgi:hypothetical protein
MRNDFVPSDTEDPSAKRETPPGERPEIRDYPEEDFGRDIFRVLGGGEARGDIAVHAREVVVVEGGQGYLITLLGRFDDFLFIEIGCQLPYLAVCHPAPRAAPKRLRPTVLLSRIGTNVPFVLEITP